MEARDARVAEYGIPALLAHTWKLVDAQDGEADSALNEIDQSLRLANDAIVQPVFLRHCAFLALSDLAVRGGRLAQHSLDVGDGII